MKRARMWMAALLLTLLLLPGTALADVGPKADLEIRVVNAPDGYYLDLLHGGGHGFDNFQYLPGTYDETLLARMRAQETENSHLALITGTNIPLYGDLVGEADGEAMVHRFTYVGVPDTFRIVIAARDGSVVVSPQVTRNAFHTVVTLDYGRNTVQVPSLPAMYARQFLFTLLLFPVEAAILITETVIYNKRLVGHTSNRRVVYGIAANLASAVIGALVTLRR